MSLTRPDDVPDDVDRPPSRRFTFLFALAMLAIAAGYAWVWQVKTSRVVAEPPPALILGALTSRVAGHDGADETALRDSLAARLRTVPRLVLAPPSAASEPAAAAGRIPPRIYALDGALDRAADGRYELALRRSDARTDSLVYIYRVRGSSLTEVVHRMTVQVAMSFGLPAPRPDPPSRTDSAGDTSAAAERIWR